ncbi:MAG: hypothetical protein EA361_00845 [Bacteroidetes bacterium]|nr:MAG: hypothetical protein EA361_00845 [Bacteroidota bacterium]
MLAHGSIFFLIKTSSSISDKKQLFKVKLNLPYYQLVIRRKTNIQGFPPFFISMANPELFPGLYDEIWVSVIKCLKECISRIL